MLYNLIGDKKPDGVANPNKTENQQSQND